MTSENLIEKYLMGELTEAELIRFQQLIDTDADFKDEVEIRSVLYADYKTDMKRELVKNLPHVRDKRRTTVRSLYRPILSIAALLSVGLFGLILFQLASTPDFNKLANAHLVEKHQAPTVVRGETNTEINWSTAVDAYRKEAYTIASTSLEKIVQTKQAAPKHNFYLGLCYLYQQPPLTKKAIQSFEKVLDSNNIFNLESKWYMSLALLQENKDEAAAEILQEIAQNKSWNHEKASKLLNEIN